MRPDYPKYEIDRRSALLLGASGVAAAFFAGSSLAVADDVKVEELAPGVTLRTLREVDPVAPIPGFKKAKLMEITYQPGAILDDPTPAAAVDICEIQGAPLLVEHPGMPPMLLQPGDIYACPVGNVEKETNNSDKPSIMRIIELVPA